MNANQLDRWVWTREQGSPPVRHDVPVVLSSFVPVVAIDEPAPIMALRSHHAIIGGRTAVDGAEQPLK